ncbi:medium chain dehydrogenase/reductase family protein [Amycolatopsis taiwanensis]|uniref:medium chain dehydrogenase/reductase family protein n=1 Tax=Amycolatopsis taiwanensis TaxID=342230 RepID=UPI000489BB65|nr:medium chain dehydrogenase/reductase family protein [Amycolatopsis taiwanensis]
MRSRHLSVTRIGGPETLQARTENIGEPGPGEALVRIEAAGVSFGDILIRLGVIPGSPKPPFTPGFDFAGEVVKTGPGVTSLTAGQPVAALVRTGGYSDHLIVPAQRLVPRPAGAGAVESAAVALNYFIAYQMLHRVAEVAPGQRILVHGASGGVGVAFLQLAQLAGIEVYGSASAEKLDLVRKFGGHPIDYRNEDFVQVIRGLPGGSVYAAFDAIGGPHFNKSSSVLERGGILVAYGQSAALVNGQAKKAVGARGFLGGIVLPKLVPNGKRSTFYNAWSLEKSHPHAYREDLAAVLNLLAQGKISPIVAKTVPLEEAPDAQRQLERGAVGGKIVLTTGVPR